MFTKHLMTIGLRPDSDAGNLKLIENRQSGDEQL